MLQPRQDDNLKSVTMKSPRLTKRADWFMYLAKDLGKNLEKGVRFP